jgi:hypothetical protein
MPIPLEPPLIGTVYLHAAMVAVVLFALTVPLALRLARREGQSWLVPLVLGALGLHFVGAALQILVVRAFYGNIADFHLYNGQGAQLAEAWREGAFPLDGLQLPGNGGVSIVTGLVYSIFGIDQLGGFFVFSWFSLIGLVAFYRAFRIALPSAQHFRYAVLIFLLPSLFYWPSTAGKEAVMMLALGTITLGAARLLSGQWQGVLPLLAGSVLGAAVRPHEVALVYGAFGVAVVTRRVLNRSLLTPIRIGLTLLIIVGGGGVLALFTARFLGINEISGAAIVKAVNQAAAATQGEGEGFGSSHDTWNPNPLYYPLDVYIVLFRPLPFEVGSSTQAIAALENLTIIGLFAFCWRSILGTFRQLRRSPFVLMCVVYSTVFMYLFSALGNEGLLARERTLLFPFLFVLFALPKSASRREAAALRRSGTRDWRVPASLR